MKKILIIMILLCSMVSVYGQDYSQTREAPIYDVRSKGLEYFDTNTRGYRLREVFIQKGLTARKSPHADTRCDTCLTFRVSFVNMYNNELVRYGIIHSGDEDFDRADYRWLNDSTVAVTLYETALNKNKEYTLITRDDRTILHVDMKED